MQSLETNIANLPEPKINVKTNVSYTSFKLSKYGQPVFTATAEYRVYSFSLNWKFCMPKTDQKKKTREKQTLKYCHYLHFRRFFHCCISTQRTQYIIYAVCTRTQCIIPLNYSLKTVQYILVTMLFHIKVQCFAST